MCDAYDVTLGRLAELIESFRGSRGKLDVPDMATPSHGNCMRHTFLIFPQTASPIRWTCTAMRVAALRSSCAPRSAGQVSVNISRPGVVKGNHWHHTKNEKFLVVKGEGVIRFRRLNTEAVYEYRVSGDKLEVVDIPTGYTHNIENVGESDMVTVMWASEPFDPERPDTYFLEV